MLGVPTLTLLAARMAADTVYLHRWPTVSWGESVGIAIILKPALKTHCFTWFIMENSNEIT